MPCGRDRRSSTSRLQPILAPRARSSQATLLDLSPAGLARGLGGAFPPGVGLRRYGELRPDIHLPTKGAPSAVTVRMTMAAARAGAPPPPLGDVVFLDPTSFVPGSLRPRLPYWEEAVRGSPQADQVLRFVREGASYEEFLVPFTGRVKGRTSLRQPRPLPRVFANHPAVYSPEFSDFVRQEIAKGLRNGGMRCLGPSVGPAAVAPPTVVCPLGIPPWLRPVDEAGGRLQRHDPGAFSLAADRDGPFVFPAGSSGG